MKIKSLYIIIFFLTCNVGYSQLWYYKNTDKKTRKKLGILIGYITARNLALGKMNKELKTAIYNHEMQRIKQYSKNGLDRKDDFLKKSVTSGSLSLATTLLGAYPKLPYMTKEKRDYLKSITRDKKILFALQLMVASKIKSGKRQEIYRLRSELIREFSKSDRRARKVLMFSAGGLVAQNPDKFKEIFEKMQLIEIAL